MGLDESTGLRPVGLGDRQAWKHGLVGKARSLSPPVTLSFEDAVVDGSPVIVAEVPECAPSAKPCRVAASGQAWIRLWVGRRLRDVDAGRAGFPGSAAAAALRPGIGRRRDLRRPRRGAGRTVVADGHRARPTRAGPVPWPRAAVPGRHPRCQGSRRADRAVGAQPSAGLAQAGQRRPGDPRRWSRPADDVPAEVAVSATAAVRSDPPRAASTGRADRTLTSGPPERHRHPPGSTERPDRADRLRNVTHQ